MPVIYTVSSEFSMGGAYAAPTLAEARRLKRDIGENSRITRVEVGKLPIRELLCAVYNREGFAVSQEDVDSGAR